jgi:hypothetical protein
LHLYPHFTPRAVATQAVHRSREQSMTIVPSPTPPLKVGIVLYPNFTLLDLAGPQSALGLHSETLLLWKSMDRVTTVLALSLATVGLISAVPMQWSFVTAFLGGSSGAAAIGYLNSVCNFGDLISPPLIARLVNK